MQGNSKHRKLKEEGHSYQIHLSPKFEGELIASKFKIFRRGDAQMHVFPDKCIGCLSLVINQQIDWCNLGQTKF